MRAPLDHMAGQELIAVLEAVRTLLSLPDNDFSWSSWKDADAALAEIDGLINAIRDGRKADVLTLEVLFAVSGPIQEVSLSSGSGTPFVALAERFDRAVEDYKRV